MKSSPPLHRDPVHRLEHEPATFGYFSDPCRAYTFPVLLCGITSPGFITGAHSTRGERFNRDFRSGHRRKNLFTALAATTVVLIISMRSTLKENEIRPVAGLKFALPSWEVDFKMFLLFFFYQGRCSVLSNQERQKEVLSLSFFKLINKKMN